MDFLLNPWRTANIDLGREEPRAVAFHRAMAQYAPTELRDAPELAELMQVRKVWLKVEADRFGLPSFKILGASWAAERLLRGRADATDLCLVAATDGNHGRAVARVARLRGLKARILVPRGTAQARIDAIASEGAAVEVVDGDYDQTVSRAAEIGSTEPGHLVLADTSWPGYEEVPRWVVEGYATMFEEIGEQLRGETPDLAWVPIGVGSLALAAARQWPGETPRLVGFEPVGADCAYRSIEAGKPVSVHGPHLSVMAGLNCGTVSRQAWPVLQARYDAFCVIDDALADEGMRLLGGQGVSAGEVSGGAVGSALAVCREQSIRRRLSIDETSSVLLLLTEGPA